VTSLDEVLAADISVRIQTLIATRRSGRVVLISRLKQAKLLHEIRKHTDLGHERSSFIRISVFWLPAIATEGLQVLGGGRDAILDT